MSIKDIILDAYSERADVPREIGLSNINDFSRKVSGVESSYGTNLTNSTSSARGIYQFLTEGKGNAFQTGLNRVKNAYTNAGMDVPDYIARARKHNDPIKLTDSQQEEVMLANVYMHPESNLKGMIEGDNKSAMNLYRKYHHTDMDHAATADRASEFFKPTEEIVTETGEVVQQPRGMGSIWDTITSPFDSGAVDAIQGNYVVKPNDNMYQIAKRHGMSLDDLVSINPQVANPHMINVGQELNLGNGWFDKL